MPQTHSGLVDQDFPTKHQEEVAVVAVVVVVAMVVTTEEEAEVGMEEDSQE